MLEILVCILFVGGSALWIALAPPNAAAERRPLSAGAALLILLGLLLILAGMAGGLFALFLFAWDGYQEDAGTGVARTVGPGILVSVISLASLASGVFTIRKTRYPTHRS
jgi:hypothetical protein